MITLLIAFDKNINDQILHLTKKESANYSVHCDICKYMGGALKNFVQIYQKDKPAKCNEEGLSPGTYNDLSLRVCLPSKNELLPFLDQVS